MRRLVWFAGGVVTGAAGASYVKRKVTTTVQKLSPANVAKGVGASVRRSGRRATTAFKVKAKRGRDASQRERELRAERDGRLLRLGEHLHPDDEVLVDGRPVESGRVILMRRPDPSARR